MKNKVLILLVLLLAIGYPVASHAQDKPAGVRILSSWLTQAWGWLTGFFSVDEANIEEDRDIPSSDSGPVVDPNGGACLGQPGGPLHPTSDSGCTVDPDGRLICSQS